MTLTLYQLSQVRGHPDRPTELSHAAAADRGVLLMLAIIAAPVAVAIALAAIGWI